MRFVIACELDYQVTAPTTMILNIEALGSPQEKIVSGTFTVEPFVKADLHQAFESANAYRRLALAPGNYTIRYAGTVDTSPRFADPRQIAEVPVARLPLEVMPYLFPSRYCQSDLLSRFAWRQFGGIGPGHERVTAICNWIYEQVDYLSGASDAQTSAYDTFSLRAGVCRDFAHLGITFCRALGIPARFVSAYGWQLAPQDFHAVFEAYLGDRWYLFDATRTAPLDGLVRIGIGRDAADTAFATFYGSIVAGRKVISVTREGKATGDADWTTQAVSIAAS